MKTTADATISVDQLTAKFKTLQLYTQLLEYVRQGKNRIRLVASCRWALRTPKVETFKIILYEIVKHIYVSLAYKKGKYFYAQKSSILYVFAHIKKMKEYLVRYIASSCMTKTQPRLKICHAHT